MTVDIFGDPQAPGWEDQNLVTIKAANGQSWRVHRMAAPAFEGLLRDLTTAGYNPASSGGFNYRTIRGSDKLSQHAFGNAIDINAAANPMMNGVLKTDMPANTAEIAAKYGLTWGGTWKNRPDPMHFEWNARAGAPGQAGAARPDLSFGPAAPAAPTTMAGIAGMFGNPAAGLAMGAPVDPFAARQQQMAERKRDEEAAAQTRRAALLSNVGAMFG